ncbi:hypothetical protein N665_0446s0027 [Sinapis alba]|nr:hypothetical protein N665_0446s0027 [Sinapis alba]
MSRRLSYVEKGKRVARSNPYPRVGRVKVPDFDNSELMRKHELTLIGRCKKRPLGVDLRQGKFQFQFESQEDLQSVLDNRLYHFAKCMTILQKWNPPVLMIQGVPVHLWSKTMLQRVGEDLSFFDSWEITATKARVRVIVNGLLSLFFNSTLEFSNGDEIPATLLYEKLEKHFRKCGLLDHEKEDRPQIIYEEKNVKAHDTTLSKRSLEKELHRQPSGFMKDARRSNPSHPHRWVDTGRRLPPSEIASSRERIPTLSGTKDRVYSPDHRSSSSQNLRRVEDSALLREIHHTPPRIPAIHVSIQYVSCADPTESAARREKVRIGEERGEIEEAARNMVIEANTINTTSTTSALNESDGTQSPTRIPALERLGLPAEAANNQSQDPSRISIKKRKVTQLRISPKRRSAPSSSTRGS